jgi:hypothetical protein
MKFKDDVVVNGQTLIAKNDAFDYSTGLVASPDSPELPKARVLSDGEVKVIQDNGYSVKVDADYGPVKLKETAYEVTSGFGGRPQVMPKQQRVVVTPKIFNDEGFKINDDARASAVKTGDGRFELTLSQRDYNTNLKKFESVSFDEGLDVGDITLSTPPKQIKRTVLEIGHEQEISQATKAFDLVPADDGKTYTFTETTASPLRAEGMKKPLYIAVDQAYTMDAATGNISRGNGRIAEAVKIGDITLNEGDAFELLNDMTRDTIIKDQNNQPKLAATAGGDGSYTLYKMDPNGQFTKAATMTLTPGADQPVADVKVADYFDLL